MRPYRAILVSSPAHPELSIARVYGGHFKQKGTSASRSGGRTEHAPHFQATNPDMWQTGEFAFSVPTGDGRTAVILFSFSNYNNPETALLTSARGREPQVWIVENWQQENLNALPGRNFPRSPPFSEVLRDAAELLWLRGVREIAHFGGPEAELLNHCATGDRKFSSNNLAWRTLIPANVCHSCSRICKLHGPLTQRIWRYTDHPHTHCALTEVVMSHMSQPEILFLSEEGYEDFYRALGELRRGVTMPMIVYAPAHLVRPHLEEERSRKPPSRT